jgi:hypothetical protein
MRLVACLFLGLSIASVAKAQDVAKPPEPAAPKFDYNPAENTLWLKMPRWKDRNGVTWVWEPMHRYGDLEQGGCFIEDSQGTRNFLLRVWKEHNEPNPSKWAPRHKLVNDLKTEIADGTAMARELKKADQEAAVARAEYQKWLYEKQLEVWKLQIMQRQALSAQQQADALRRIANALDRAYGY